MWKGHGGEKARSSSVSFYRLTTYAADGPQAFLKPLTRDEWTARFAKARAAKDLHHSRNGKQKSIIKLRIDAVPETGTSPVPETGTRPPRASPRNRDKTPQPVPETGTIPNNGVHWAATPAGTPPAYELKQGERLTDEWLARAYGGEKELASARGRNVRS